MRRLRPEDWPEVAREVALLLWDACHDATPTSSRVKQTHDHWSLSIARRIARDLAGDASPTWTPEMAARVARHPDVDLSPRRDRPDDGVFGHRDTLPFKAVRIAHAIVNADASGLSREEMRWFAAACEGRDWTCGAIGKAARAMLERAPDEPLHPSRVDFVHAWRGHRPRSRITQSVYIGHGVVQLSTVAPDAAPVVARLHSPQGPSIGLRRMGDVFLRPVLAPGRWEPVRVAEFVASAATGVPWVDSPFVAADTDRSMVLGVSDFAATAPSTGHPSDATARRDALDAAVARAGTIVVIDGVVHKSTEPPTLIVNARDEERVEDGSIMMLAEISLTVGWAFADGLHMHAQQGTIGRTSSIHMPRDHLEGRTLRRGKGLAFPLSEGVRLERLLEEWLADPATKTWSDVRLVPGVPVEVTDPSALPVDPDASFRDLMAWQRAFGDPDATHVADALTHARSRGLQIELPEVLEGGSFHGLTIDALSLLANLVRQADEEIALRSGADFVVGFAP